MKMKSILMVMLTLCLMVCLCACGNDASTDDNTSKTTQATANATTTTTTTTTQTTTTAFKANVAIYTVTVTDEAGNPISGAFVQLCLDSCTPCITNETGTASYQMLVADYKVSFISVPEGYVLPTDEYHFEEGSYEMTLVLKAAA